MEITVKYNVKQSKNGKFPSNYKASQIDFGTQISLHRLALLNKSPSKNKPLRKGLGKYKPRGLFSEFYGILFTHKNDGFGAISVTEQGCAAPISKVESHASNRR